MKIQTQYVPAGFWVRGLALVLDALVVGGVVWVLSVLLLKVWHLPESSIREFDQQDAISLVFVIFSGAYNVRSWLTSGSTPGKKLLGLSVVRVTDGNTVTLTQALVRWMMYLLSFASFGVGFLMVLFHPRKLGLHDILSRTQVVKKPQVFVPQGR